MGLFSGITLSDIDLIDLRIRVKEGIASIFGKVYLKNSAEIRVSELEEEISEKDLPIYKNSADFRVFGFVEEISEKDLPAYLEKMETEVSKSGTKFKHSFTRWGWLIALEKAMWGASAGHILTPHNCPACVLMEGVFIK